MLIDAMKGDFHDWMCKKKHRGTRTNYVRDYLFYAKADLTPFCKFYLTFQLQSRFLLVLSLIGLFLLVLFLAVLAV
jgi:hypothetical protein